MKRIKKERKKKSLDGTKDSKEKVFRKRVCRFCSDPKLPMDVKDGKAFRPFLTEKDKLLPRRNTGLCAFHQRRLTNAVKKGRILGILPFATSQQIPSLNLRK